MLRHGTTALIGLVLLAGCATLSTSVQPNFSSDPARPVPDSFELLARPAFTEVRVLDAGPVEEPIHILSGRSSSPAARAQGGMSQIHPPTTVSYTLAYGKQKFDINTGDTSSPSPVLRMSAPALFHNLRVEHFFVSQLGAYFSADFGSGDDILEDLGISDSSIDTIMGFLGVSYRATVDDDFRMPVRFGPYYHRASVAGFSGGDVNYSTLGIKLSAEPEYIILQQLEGQRMSELSAFLHLSVGAGPSKVENDDISESGYAFSFGAELGVRYKFRFGLLIGLSWLVGKQNYGTTDSYNNGSAFFGTDDDLSAIALTAGARL